MSDQSGPLAGKVALITGASRGIGAATAIALAEQGATIVVNYSRSAGPANELVSKIGSEQAIALQADVADLTQARELIAGVVDRYGKIDILILNAALIPTNGTLEAVTETDFDNVFGVNVKSPFFMTKEAAPHIPDGGRVILFSSSTTVVSQILPGYLLYAASKGAIEQMSRVLAKDLGRRGVTVNTVSPGPTATDGFYDGKTEQVIKNIESWHPSGRIGLPEEIASVITFLAGPGANWINGQNIRINGGMTVG